MNGKFSCINLPEIKSLVPLVLSHWHFITVHFYLPSLYMFTRCTGACDHSEPFGTDVPSFFSSAQHVIDSINSY